MEKSQVLERIKSIGIIPVVRASSGDEALAAVEAIKAGGLSVLEITMTVPGAVGIIEQIAKRYGDEVLVGAGTVLKVAFRVIWWRLADGGGHKATICLCKVEHLLGKAANAVYCLK